MIIWEADRKGKFKGPEIVTYLRALQSIGTQKGGTTTAPAQPKPVQPVSGYKPYPVQPTMNQYQNAAPQQPDQASYEAESLIGQPIQISLYPTEGGDGKQTVGLAPVGLHPTSKPDSTPLPRVASQPGASGATAVVEEEEELLEEKTKSAIEVLMEKIGGGQFIYLCQACFDGAPPCMSTKAEGNSKKCSNEEQPHTWNKEKTLVHVLVENGKYRYWKIRHRPNGIPARAFLCWHREKKYGCVVGNTCKFGHNTVEVEVWEFEVFNVVSRDNIVQYFIEATRKQMAANARAVAAAAASGAQPPQVVPIKVIPSMPLVAPFRFVMKLVCDFCYTRKQQVEQSATNPAKCGGNNPHDWIKPVCLLWSLTRKRWHRVYPRHPKLRPDVKPSLCRHGERCDVRGIYSMPCMFPHIPEEVELWNYMAENKCKYEIW